MSESIVSLLVSCSFPTKSADVLVHIQPSFVQTVLTLDSSRNTLILKTLDILRSEFSSEERIFREGLKVTTTERMTMHADSWS
jgi:hypothetical protein